MERKLCPTADYDLKLFDVNLAEAALKANLRDLPCAIASGGSPLHASQPGSTLMQSCVI